MRDAGYNYVTLDDCFAMRRSAAGELYPSPNLFPRGFAPVVERAHAGGFQFGVYTSAGNMTCHAKKEDCGGACNVGSLGHYAADAKTYANWSMDFMKMDWCSASVAKLKCEDQYREMAAALNATGRAITFYMSCGGGGRGQAWSSEVANIWYLLGSSSPLLLCRCCRCCSADTSLLTGVSETTTWTAGTMARALGRLGTGATVTVPSRPLATSEVCQSSPALVVGTQATFSRLGGRAAISLPSLETYARSSR
eukprot:SAG11_NODE_101_length_16738_cov_8.254703_17_plen_252_part_00